MAIDPFTLREPWRRYVSSAQAAQRRADTGFASAGEVAQREIVGDFADGELSGGVWDELDAATAWSVVMRAVLAAFYAHPWAWNEIGFAGPAYPRGYKNAGVGRVEPFEVRDARPFGDPIREGALCPA